MDDRLACEVLSSVLLRPELNHKDFAKCSQKCAKFEQMLPIAKIELNR